MKESAERNKERVVVTVEVPVVALVVHPYGACAVEVLGDVTRVVDHDPFPLAGL